MFNKLPQRMPKAQRMPKFSGMEQQVSSDPSGMTNVTRPAPKRNMNSGALVGDMSRPEVNPRLSGRTDVRPRSNPTIDAFRGQVRKRQMGM